MAKADHDLASALGVPVSVILDMRTGPEPVLLKGEHWTDADAGRVVYTAAGLALARVRLSPEKKEGGAAVDVDRGAVAPSAAALEPGRPERLLVLVRCPNPLWVAVRTPDGLKVLVNVRSNKKLSPGKRLKCRPWPDGRWECVETRQAVPLKALAP